MSTIRVDRQFEGPPGTGQGGWTAWCFAAKLDGPVTIALRAPVPLDTDLQIAEHDDRWTLFHEHDGDRTTVLEAERWVPHFVDTEPVSVTEAELARERFEYTSHDHPAAGCFSCGIHKKSMRVHAGPLGDGRHATDWTAPDWPSTAEGEPPPAGLLWAALDCTAAWYAGTGGGNRRVFTVQYAAETFEPLVAGARYALVGWAGDYEPGWDGRKRGAASAAFAADGACVARSRSFWVAVD